MEELEKRINRINGQLKGILKMAQEKRECGEILQQISAVKKAIDALTKELVVSDVCRFVPEEKKKQIEKMVEQAINL